MHHPFAELVGLLVISQQPGASVCELEVHAERHHNPHGVVHGAVLYALADTGMGAALYPTLSDGQYCATVEIKISYFRPVKHGVITCRTELVNRGRRLANLDARIYLDDQLIAKANGNFAILDPS